MMRVKYLGWFVQVGLEGGQKSLLLFNQKPAFALKIGRLGDLKLNQKTFNF